MGIPFSILDIHHEIVRDLLMKVFFMFRYPKVTSKIPEKESTSPINFRKVKRSFKKIVANIKTKITLV